MLIKILCYPFWVLIECLIALLPAPLIEGFVSTKFMALLSTGIAVVGADNFIKMISSVLFWYTLQLIWAVLEWVYRKIPGVN